MTELEKIQKLNKKYRNSMNIFTVYKREHTNRGFVFTLIFGTDSQRKVKEYIKEKEEEGRSLFVYSANLREKSSALVYRTKE